MKNLLLLFTLCLTLNLSAQNNPPGSSPIQQQLSVLNKGGFLSSDDFKIQEDYFKPNGLSASITSQRKSPTDAIQLQDSIYNWGWDSSLNDWIINSKTTDIIYDANNNISSYIGSEWDGLDWVKTSEYTYTYDANHNPTSNIKRSWNGVSWQNDNQDIYAYDANNNLLSYTSQNWNGTDWVNSIRYSYTHNENNDLTSGLFEKWENDAWENNIQQMTTYDANFNKIHYLFQLWENNAWENNQQTTTSYDENNNAVLAIKEIWDGSSWVNNLQSTFEYDAANNLTSEENLTWNGVDWQYQSYLTYIYDTGNKLISGLRHFWNGVGWEPNRKYLYAYDSHDNLIVYDIQEFTGTWESVERSSYNFDENDFQVYEVFKIFDLSGVVLYGDSTHYYYRTITAIGDVLPGLDQITISPNPAIDLVTISSDNEINGISAFSLLGKQIYTTEKTDNIQSNEIDISTWPSGIYLVQVREGDNLCTRKLVVQ